MLDRSGGHLNFPAPKGTKASAGPGKDQKEKRSQL